MKQIEKILVSNLKPKEKIKKIIGLINNKEILIEDLISFFIMASDVKKGTCADIFKHIAKENPDILAPYIDVLIDYIHYDAPRVKWGVQEAIGNLARKYPDKVVKAIPELLKNTEENKTNTTVVRWCAAYGLSEILINNKNIQKDLLPKIQNIIGSEKNNGVKNVYLKALKRIE